MKQINPKDKSMVARMAGNIAGGAYFVETHHRNMLPERRNEIAREAVELAMDIINVINSYTPCGECDGCDSGIRCRELPGEES